MPTRVKIPLPYQQHTGGVAEVEAEGGTVGEVIASVAEAHPALADKLLEADGTIRAFVAVFVNDRDARFEQGPQTAVGPDDVVRLVVLTAGG